MNEQQLTSWANQGATVTAKNTYASIQMALKASTSPISHLIDNQIQVYLQGSYGNDTNIRGDSDVDVVVEYNGAWGSDLSNLSDEELEAYRRDHSSAEYTFTQLREDVITALENYYGVAFIEPGNKAIKVLPSSGRLKADVIPAMQYKKFYYYFGRDSQNFARGIKFVAQNTGRIVINYPKEHLKNGQGKNSREQTNGWYKPTVRMFKNARSALLDAGWLDEGQAPSYFVESLLYNVPNNLFGGSYKYTFDNITEYLNGMDEDSLRSLQCQNGMLPLIGASDEQWNLEDAVMFIVGLKTEL